MHRKYKSILTREQWVELVISQIKDYRELDRKYRSELSNTTADNSNHRKWLSLQIESVDSQLKEYTRLKKWEEREKGFLMYFLNEEGEICFSRIGRMASAQIYKPKSYIL